MDDLARLYQERDEYLQKAEEINRRGGTAKAIAEVMDEAKKRQRQIDELERSGSG